MKELSAEAGELTMTMAKEIYGSPATRVKLNLAMQVEFGLFGSKAESLVRYVHSTKICFEQIIV